jgi:hypothetical protein
MALAETSFYLFSIFNALRIVSYVPQIFSVARDSNGASAISYATWALWTASNASTALYAAVNLGDRPLAMINMMNAACCMVVIVLTIYKRKQFRFRNDTASVAGSLSIVSNSVPE